MFSKNDSHTKSHIIFLKLSCFLILLISTVVFYNCSFMYHIVEAKSKKPTFSKTISSLVVGESATLSVKHIPKKGSVRFFTSDSQILSVQKNPASKNAKKQRIVIAKKEGMATITAKIFRKKRKPTAKLSMKIFVQNSQNQTSDSASLDISNETDVPSFAFPEDSKNDTSSEEETNLINIDNINPEESTVTEQSSQEMVEDDSSIDTTTDYLKNAAFSVKQNINPYNYTLTLISSRILLTQEIQNSVLSIIPEGKKEPKLSADFSSLSQNGKEIIYLLDSSSQQKLCPRDNSMNGNYIIHSPSFSEELTIHYEERLQTEDISGFVLDIDGTPLTNTFISYQTTDSFTSTHTDETGHYHIKAKGNPLSLSAQKEGYETETISNLTLESQETICENIILRPSEEKKYSFDILVTDEKKRPIPEAKVYLFHKEEISTQQNGTFTEERFLPEHALLSEKTDAEGFLLFSDHEIHVCKSSKIILDKGHQVSMQTSYTPVPSKIHPLPKSFSPKEQYTLLILKETSDGTSAFTPYKVTFCPALFYTRHLSFEVHLESKKYIDTSHLLITCPSEINTDKNENQFHLSLYKAGEKNIYYQTHFPLSQNSGTDDSETNAQMDTGLSTFHLPELPLSLTDGVYYLRITRNNKNGEPIMSSPISKIEVQNSRISPMILSLEPTTYARFFVYYPKEKKPLETLEIELYQKTESEYFYMETLISSDFVERSSDLFTTDILISSLLPSQTYLFLSHGENLHLTSYLISEISSSNLHNTEQEAILAAPFLQSSCTNTQTFHRFPENFSPKKILLYERKSMTFTQETIRLENSYPNSVVALYKKDGTFISTTLSPKLDKHTVFSKNKSLLVDIYTNHEPMMTNQYPYILAEN